MPIPAAGAPVTTRVRYEPDVLSVANVARLLDCSPATVHRAIRRGGVRTIHLASGGLRIPVTELPKLTRRKPT